MWAHLTARAYDMPHGLHHPAVAGWLWPRLRAAFPDAIAACLMPDHLHIVLRVLSLLAAQRALAAIVSGLSRSNNPGAAIRWDRIPTPTCIAGPAKLRRDVRYVSLNPNRAGLVRDPLSWLWSTHRDVMGAVSNPWITPDRLADALERPRRGFREAHHRYVSSDPSADTAGTPLPHAVAPSTLPVQPLHELLAACAAALRSPVETVLQRSPLRRLFVTLSEQHGWHDARLLSQISGVTPSSLRRLRQRPPPPDLAAAQLCLGDRRLRSPYARQAEELVQQRLTGSRRQVAHTYRSGAHLPPTSSHPLLI